MDRLPADLKRQRENAAQVERRLQRTKGAWWVWIGAWIGWSERDQGRLLSYIGCGG